jgi:hypothetical protein
MSYNFNMKYLYLTMPFFDTTIHEIAHVLKTRINDKFEVVRHNTVQLSS